MNEHQSTNFFNIDPSGVTTPAGYNFCYTPFFFFVQPKSSVNEASMQEDGNV